ncbi:hypothetical protein INT43_000904 [Umbelopsis isabellina]|uniref:Uncharacterized protein n=1 Tax=Mortierella isabellina TaxID=91625 RepID=A0A8H7Q377_MORIS|nr:hypothetical protein INT43_000904 [Umbelopsis isabellina]
MKNNLNLWKFAFQRVTMASADINEVHVEKAHNILNALPRMSKDIVDDTIYEKVLSFLSSFLDSEAHGVQMYDSWHVLDILTETCESKEQDPRIKAVCLRFLGKLISRDDAPNSVLCAKLIQDNRSLLDQVQVCSTASEGALRVAAIEACQGFACTKAGLKWLRDSSAMQSNIVISLQSTNTYVRDPASQIQKTLNEKLKVSSASTNQKRWACREFCWAMASATSDVHENDRLNRNRNVEIISTVFALAPQPMLLLSKDCQVDSNSDLAISKAHEATTVKALEYLNIDNLECIITGMQLLKATLILAKRLPPSVAAPKVQALCILMTELLELCLNEDYRLDVPDFQDYSELQTLLWNNQRSISKRKSVVIHAFKIIHIITHDFRNIVAQTKLLETLLDILADKSMTADLHILKPLLSQLSPLLATAGPNNDDASSTTGTMVESTLSVLTRYLEDPSMDSRAVKSILETIDSFLCNPVLNDLILQKTVSTKITQAITLRLFDTEWDTRDSVVAFIGSLYDRPYIESRIVFAEHNNLALEVIQKIEDGEAYVRSAALDALQNMMNNASGWIYIKNNELTKHINTKLPPLIHDPEALVRRAALDSISCLIQNQSYENLFGSNGLSSSNMAALIDDTDWETRLRVCKLLHVLWIAERHNLSRSKRSNVNDNTQKPQFYVLGGDKLLLLAIQDPARLVRKTTMEALKDIMEDFGHGIFNEPIVSVKRPLELSDEDEMFCASIRKIDFDILETTISAEHMYEETFDIDYSGVDIASMTESLRDTNMLDCE